MKKKIAVYSAHSEVVGGDVKYIVDLLNVLPTDIFEFFIYTDKNCGFESLAKQWLKKPIKINFLETAPRLFCPNLFERLSNFLGLSQGTSKYLGYLYKIITFHHLRLLLQNKKVFRKLFSENQFDVVWVNNGGYPGKQAAQIACLEAARAGVSRVIMTFHSLPASRLPFKPSEKYYDRALNSALSVVVAVSKALKEKLVTVREFSPKLVQVLYCGLEDQRPLSKTEVDNLRIDLELNNENVLLITGTLDGQKGHETLFRALKDVVVEIPNTSLLVVGSGRADRLQELKELAKRLGVVDKIKFLGHRTDIHDLNSVADVVIVPSEGSEATPYTIKEAQRASRAVIGSTVGGISEAVIDNETGLLFSTGDSHDLSKKIILLLRDENLRFRLARQGRQLFEEKFLITNQISNYRKILLGDP